MSSSSDDEDEYTSLADKLKDKYVSSIEATLKTIERVQLVSSQLIDTQHKSSNATTTTRKRKADRRLASWIDARIEPQRTNSTGPGCSICISTFEELQSEGKQVLRSIFVFTIQLILLIS